MSKKIEIQFRIKNFQAIIDRLNLVGAKLIWKGREDNFFYDTFSRQLAQESKILRFHREPDQKNILTLKRLSINANQFFVQNDCQIVTDHFKETHRILRH